MSYKLLLLVSALVWRRDARVTADITGGSATVVVGSTAILPCMVTLQQGQELEQISWQRQTTAKPKLDNFFTIRKDGARFVNGNDNRFSFIGAFDDQIGTLQLSNVKPLDAGNYTCVFSIFPIGNLKTSIPLKVFEPPTTSVNSTFPTLGDQEVPLATCTVAYFPPPVIVMWKVDALKDKVRWTNDSNSHPSGTTTIVSVLLGKPTKEINNSPVECEIFSEILKETLPFIIQIYYPPLMVNIKEEKEGKDKGLTCEADANPLPTFTWSRPGTHLPPSITAEGSLLTFNSISPDLTGLYRCEANNTYGSKQSTFYVHFIRESSKDGWIAFGILLVVVFAVAAAMYKQGYLKLPRCPKVGRESVPTSSPEPENASL